MEEKKPELKNIFSLDPNRRRQRYSQPGSTGLESFRIHAGDLVSFGIPVHEHPESSIKNCLHTPTPNLPPDLSPTQQITSTAHRCPTGPCIFSLSPERDPPLKIKPMKLNMLKRLLAFFRTPNGVCVLLACVAALLAGVFRRFLFM